MQVFASANRQAFALGLLASLLLFRSDRVHRALDLGYRAVANPLLAASMLRAGRKAAARGHV